MQKHYVTEVRYNYYPGSITGEFGERYESRILQIDGVVEIKEDSDGGKIVYDVIYETGQIERVFNPHWSHLMPVK